MVTSHHLGENQVPCYERKELTGEIKKEKTIGKAGQ